MPISRQNWYQYSLNLSTNLEQVRPKIGKKLRTAYLNSKFTSSLVLNKNRDHNLKRQNAIINGRKALRQH